MSSYIGNLQEAQNAASRATKKREKEIRGYLDEIIARYGPEGGFGEGYEAQLQRSKTQDVASGAQSLVGSGLYNTTQTAGLGKKWEEEVGAPARLKLEDLRSERLSQAQSDKAGFVERIEDMYPDYGLISQMMQQASSAPMQSINDSPASWETGGRGYQSTPNYAQASSGPTRGTGPTPGGSGASGMIDYSADYERMKADTSPEKPLWEIEQSFTNPNIMKKKLFAEYW